MANNAEKCFKIRLWVSSQHCLFYFSMCLILFVIKEDRERERRHARVCVCYGSSKYSCKAEAMN